MASSDKQDPILAEFGSAIYDLCARDSVNEFRAWTEQKKVTNWTGLLTAAAWRDAAEIVGFCLQQGAKVDEKPVMKAIIYDKAERVHKKLVEAKLIGPYHTIERIGDVLSVAVSNNNVEWTDFCLKHNADPNFWLYDEYKTVLAEAAENGNTTIIGLLLANGASKQNSGALIFAAEAGKKDAVTLLLHKGFDINEIGVAHPQDPRTLADVGTALHKAVEHNHSDVVDILLRAGIDTSLKDGQGRTALELAQELKQEETVAKLEKLSTA
ncbi:hypothetical protein AMS68_005731 [Peltaster fructicola]|uniref:Uncharacterized protein n=1 Tax=Peltaster fructicola TaxID=286661 RepID=A0A6H0XZP1_9PEZI|nr:hypothetical protein AMS68_005731 [Peltaster fructicola]